MTCLSLSLSLLVLTLSPSAWAAGVTSDCSAGDAPPGYDTETCQSACSQSVTGETWTCDLSAVCAGAGNAWIVHDYGNAGDHHFSFWAGCPGVNLVCCTFDDTAVPREITKVTLIGTQWNDELSFTLASDPVEDLRNHTTAHLDGFIFGGSDADILNGSNFVGNAYRDNLYGEAGADDILGNADGDWMSGGSGPDTLDGGAGDDRMVGDAGNDEFFGGADHDTLCDSSGAGGLCATDQEHLFMGDDGDDMIWYGQDAGCLTREMDPLSDGGAGGNNCGDTVWGAALPVNCVASLMGAPPECTDPN